MSETMWQRDDNWVGSEIEDSFVMINIDTGKYVALNATASLVWHALEAPHSEAEIVARLRAGFDIAEVPCAQSVAILLEDMRRLQLAQPV